MLQRSEQLTLHRLYETFVFANKARNLSKTTHKFYDFTVKPFVEWCEEQNIQFAEQLTPNTIRGYLIKLFDEGKAAHTQHKTARAVRTFCIFLSAEKYLPTSPFDGVKMPKLPKAMPIIFSAGEIEKIKEKCVDDREKAICLFLLDSGVRAAELCNLTVGDVDLGTGEVKIWHGKGNKDRICYIGRKTRLALARYLGTRGYNSPSNPLFMTERYGNFSLRGFGNAMDRIRKRTGIKHLEPHTFRRTYAVFSLRNGMNIYMLARLMGHEDITVLKHYLDFVQADLNDAQRKFGVVDNLK